MSLHPADHSSRDLLWRLIAERAAAEGDERDAIDARIREMFEETWAVVFTDLVGFSKRTREFGILHFLTLIHEKSRLLGPLVEQGGGRILKEEADSWLLLFRSPVRAVETMRECQRACEEHNRGRAKEDRVELCVGIGWGTVLRIGDADVWGEEVNSASRLGEDTAEGGEILLTEAVRLAVEHEIRDLDLEPCAARGGTAARSWRIRESSRRD